MTREEAIWYLSPIAESATLVRYKEALQMAISALRAQQEAENNEPLTLDELREMDEEPVWLRIGGGVWGLVDTSDSIVWLGRNGDIDLNKIVGLAYRRKPEGGGRQ